MKAGFVKGVTFEDKPQMSFFVTYTFEELQKRFDAKVGKVPGLADEASRLVRESVQLFETNMKAESGTV